MSSRRSDSPWRKAVVRSRSLPRIGRSSRRQDDGKAQRKQGVAAWAPGWLLTPQVSRGRKNLKKEYTAFDHRPLIRRTPVLTLLLIRLDENMQGYCEQLSDPTVERAAAASAILETTVATATSPLSSPSSSSVGSPPSRAPLLPLSPRSPRSSASAMMLEGEWEKYVSPLMLLAGAEAIFAQMEHVLHNETYKGLLSLYQKIEEDLLIVKETLCFPFLEKEVEKPKTTLPPEESSYLMAHKAASSLAKSLDALMLITAVRRELIGLHHDMFHDGAEEKDLLELSVRCRSLLKGLPACDVSECGAVLVMMQSLVTEIKALTAALASAHHLQRCSFMDTVLNAKVLKNHMRTTPPTILQVWFRHTLENLLSVMPIFFDRIDAFATPLYGFDKTHMVNGVAVGDRIGVVHDYESSILEFLRRHESKGGAPMAVTVILDAGQTSSFHVERGYEGGQHDQEAPSEEWPAIYMRTTIHSGSSSTHARSSIVRGKLGIASSAFRSSQRHLKNASTRDLSLGADDYGALSQATLRRSWSSDAGSPKNKRRKEPHFNVLEYAPDSGKSSWPHTEWERLVPHLHSPNETSDGKKTDSPEGAGPFSGPSMGGIVTYRSSELNSSTKTDSSVNSEAQSSPSGSPTAKPWIAELVSDKQQITPPPPPLTRTPSGLPSVYHVSRLNEYMWMVVIVKEEAAKWHRRKPRGYSDEDIHSFLHDMTLKLCIERLFRVETVKHARNALKSSRGNARSISLNRFSSAEKWRDIEVHLFLGSLKESFGLRPQSPMRTPLKSPYQIGQYRRGRNLDARDRTQSSFTEAADELDSAIAFFFGPELRACMKWQWYE